MNRRHSIHHHHSDEEKTTVERLLGVVVGLQWWLLLALGVAGGVFYYRQPIAAPKELQASIKRLKSEKTALETERDKLVNRVEWAKNDDQFLEILARDRLNKQKDGEVILRFKE